MADDVLHAADAEIIAEENYYYSAPPPRSLRLCGEFPGNNNENNANMAGKVAWSLAQTQA